MTYNFIVENDRGRQYKASVQGWPSCSVAAATREEALRRLRATLLERLSEVEVVPVEIELPQSAHPWMKFAGMYRDDPMFDEVQEEIAAYRRELDAEADPE